MCIHETGRDKNNNRKRNNKQNATEFDSVRQFILSRRRRRKTAKGIHKNIYVKTIDGWASTTTTENVYPTTIQLLNFEI
jgi:hypothetical protein